MLWFYYASAVVFLGAELVRAIGLESRPPAASPEEKGSGVFTGKNRGDG